MKKVANTYWNNSPISLKKTKDRFEKSNRKKKSTPEWFIFTVIVSITFLLCLAINFRAFSEMRSQSNENNELNAQIEKLKTETVVLEEEIKNLKNDPKTIAREARKIGMSRPNEKILVPVN